MDNEYNFSSAFLETHKTAALVDVARTLSMYASIIDHMADEIGEMRSALRRKDEELKNKDSEIQKIKYSTQNQIAHADQQVIMMRKRLETELNTSTKEKGEKTNV